MSILKTRIEDMVLENIETVYQTERIVREIISGHSIEDLYCTLDIPEWQLTLRIANFGLHCYQLAVLRGETPYGPAFEHHCPDRVEAFNEEQSKAVVVETVAHMMAGTPPVPALLMAECLQAQMIAKEDEMNRSEDDSWFGCSSDEGFGGKGKQKGKGEKNGSKAKAGKAAVAPDGGKAAAAAAVKGGKPPTTGLAIAANGAKMAEKTTAKGEKAAQGGKQTAVDEAKIMAKKNKAALEALKAMSLKERAPLL
ncbi:hypothetical protein LTR67_003036 [Exophiala xenobiotica]|jgi:hypothetical protein